MAGMIENKIIVEMSARHIHLSDTDLAILFGEGYQLTKKKDLSQPGQYVCEEKVKVVGTKGSLILSVMGPTRKKTQVEVSLTEARTLGVHAPVRESGDIEGSGACRLIGPAGELDLKEGVIAAKRHIHMSPEHAEFLSVKDREVVCLEIETPERSAIYKNFVIRVSASSVTAAHIDTDEANGIAMNGCVWGKIC